MYVDHRGRRIWNPFRKVRAKIDESHQDVLKQLRGVETNLTKGQQNVVQAVRGELYSHRETMQVKIDEILGLQRSIAENVAKLTETFQALTGSADEVTQDNQHRALENYGRNLEEFAGEIIEGGLPKPPSGLTGRG